MRISPCLCLTQIDATLPWYQKLCNTTITGAGLRLNLTRLKCESQHLPVTKKTLPYHDIRNYSTPQILHAQLWDLALAKKTPPCHDIRNRTTLPLLEQAQGSTWSGSIVKLSNCTCLKKRFPAMTSVTVQHYNYWSRLEAQPDQAQMRDLALTRA